MKKFLLAIGFICASLVAQQAVCAQAVTPTPEPFLIQPQVLNHNDGSACRFVNIPTPISIRQHNGHTGLMPLLMSEPSTAKGSPFWDIVVPPVPADCNFNFAVFPFSSVAMDIWGTDNGFDVVSKGGQGGFVFGPYFQMIDYTNPQASVFFGMGLAHKIADLPPLPGTVAHGSRITFTPDLFAPYGLKAGDLISVEIETGMGAGTTYIDNVHINGEQQAIGKSMVVCP